MTYRERLRFHIFQDGIIVLPADLARSIRTQKATVSKSIAKAGARAGRAHLRSDVKIHAEYDDIRGQV